MRNPDADILQNERTQAMLDSLKDASHELGQALMVIMGSLELLARKLDQPEHLEYVDRSLKAGKRAYNALNHIRETREAYITRNF
ncbi:MAG TPA: hypothetical protein ENH82_05210 [bacterium]|nr:hypothetical protein [bacterium]